MIADRIRKLRGRSLLEWRERSAQVAARWIESVGLGDVGEPTEERITRLIGPASPGPAVRGQFFPSLAERDATVAALGALDSRFADALRVRADRILGGHVDLLGHHDLVLKEPIDWWRDPTTGIRAPDHHWSRIAFLDPQVAGDHKAVWELGRHRALLTLAQAWWCTGDARYADAVNRLMQSWMDANVPKRGIHWASSLEVSFRSMTWLWILALMGNAMPARLVRRALAHLAISARHIERHLSTWFSPNTHLTGEALGLYTLGSALPQCPDALRWKTTGESILREWINRHVRDDGTYVEQSTWYHRYTADFFLHFLILDARGNAEGNSAWVRPPLEKLLDVLCWMSRPDGTFPMIGDDDGGRLLFLDDEPAQSARTTLSVGAAIFGRGDWAHVANKPTAELVWLLGAEGLTVFEALRPTPPAERSRAFTAGGLFVARSGWDHTASVLTIDAGPHGFLNGGHAHADALSIDLTVRGVPLFVDPGTYTYTLFPEWRDRFRATSSHNAATVDGHASAVPAGPFQWASRAMAQCDRWSDDGETLLFSGTHDGFSQGPAPVTYRRTILYLRPSIWIVRDEIRGDGKHELAVHWQCHSAIACALTPDGSARLDHPGGMSVSMRTAEPAEWRVDEGWVSPVHGVREPAPRLTAVTSGQNAVRLTTLIAIVPAEVTIDRVAATGPPSTAAPEDAFRVTYRLHPGDAARDARFPVFEEFSSS